MAAIKGKVFAQLYSIVRQERDGHIEAMRKLSEIGYDGVELLGNNTNGLTVEEYKKVLSDLNLKVNGSHNLHTEDDFAFGEALGLKYAIFGGCDRVTDMEKLKKICEEYNDFGRRVAKFGMKALMHNHGEEFWWIDEETKEKRVFEFIAENTDPDLVGFELDAGWVVRAGLDPVDVINRYAGRIPLIHMKECAYPAVDFEDLEHFPAKVLQMGEPKMINGVPYFTEEQKAFMDNTRRWNVELGTGIVDFKAIVEAAEAQGCEAYVNEREYYHLSAVPDSDPVKCAAIDYEFLKTL